MNQIKIQCKKDDILKPKVEEEEDTREKHLRGIDLFLHKLGNKFKGRSFGEMMAHSRADPGLYHDDRL